MSSVTFTSSAPASEQYDRRAMTEFRSWRRRAIWSRRNKAIPLRDMTMMPWHLAKGVYRASRVYAPLVSKTFGLPTHRQLIHLFWARARYGLDPSSYYRFQLFRPERWQRVERYLQTSDTSLVLRWLVAQVPEYPPVFFDKRAFAAWCGEHGFPSVSTLMEFEGGEATWSAASGASLPEADLFSKPANSQGGDGVLRWTYAGAGHYVGSDGRACDSRELIAGLARLSADLGRPVLLQRTLRNASSLAHLTLGALCTARVVTMRPPDGRPQLLYAVYRMPVGGTIADNFDKGGLAAPIDLATGRLGAAVRKHPSFLGTRVVRHPDTGAAIEGHQLPDWSEAVSLAVRAHEAIAWEGVPFIGWDIALLDEGPVLLEGNNVPCSTLAQMASEVPAGESPFVACLNAHLRARAPGARAVHDAGPSGLGR